MLLGIYRGVIVDPQPAFQGVLASIPAGLAASYYDLILIASLTAATLVLLFLAKPSRLASAAIVLLFYLVVAVSLAWGFANINLVKMLGEPFTFQWLVYGDFLQNADAKSAMGDALNVRDAAILFGSIILVLVLGYAAGRLCQRLSSAGRKAFLVALVLGVGAGLAGSGYHVRAQALPASKIDNPIVYFVQSAWFSSTPVTFAMSAASNDPDVASVGERPAETSSFKAPAPNPVKNVLIFMMESVPSKYVETFGGQYPVTPNIKSYAAGSIRFDKIYAHAPSTHYSIFSLLTSMYNDISFYGMTAKYPYLPLDTISNTLSRHNFRTGFFWSADSRFQRVDEFLLNKGLDVIQDYRGQKCATPTFKLSSEQWKNMDYNSDLCTAQSIIEWMNKDSQKPFFGIMFTAMTHYPYITGSPMFSKMVPSAKDIGPVRYVDDEKFNAYLNALKVGDAAFGEILESLKQSGKLDSTLVVVLGDHGEAFGEHGDYIHATAIYDENVHIPLIMINKHLFHGEVAHPVGGIIDVAPTIMDILGLPLPQQWQGRSLFSEQRPDKTFFFNPWAGSLLGYRENDRKVIFNATTGKVEEYDLKADPGERTNLFNESSSDRTTLLQPISGWVQSQKRRVATLVGNAAQDAGHCSATSLEIDAAGTDYQGAPHFEVFADGKRLAEIAVQGKHSAASTAEARVAELTEAAIGAQPFRIDLSGVPNPKSIEVRYVNDQWAGDGLPGDRNLFIKSIKVNGQLVPNGKLHVDEQSHGYTDDSGTAMYTNGSLWVSGPFIEGCM
ncbi:sulfatase-like hydrolase/transferase [Mesorhizobium tamadayense]|uniref:sulfatase-like hydrolase/transferase n=1 Tax=Mesorhizobium tamadayense TaxID=425306 RepID=UPI00142DF1CF|nr:sulfatase-like hydrolase/transferase [Mesorhizobium tamadayense]